MKKPGNKKPHWFFWVIARFLSNNIKRKIVMIAAFCEIERSRGIEVPRVEKLNKALKITHTEALLYGLRDIATPLSAEVFCESSSRLCDVATLCNLLTDTVPEYLQYADRETMLSDIAKVIVCNVK